MGLTVDNGKPVNWIEPETEEEEEQKTGKIVLPEKVV